MHLLHSSIEQFFIVQMQHALMLNTRRGSLTLAVIIQAALSSSLGSVCTSGDTTFLPVSSLKRQRLLPHWKLKALSSSLGWT